MVVVAVQSRGFRTRVVGAGLVVALCAAAAGCGGDDDDDAAPESTGAAAVASSVGADDDDAPVSSDGGGVSETSSAATEPSATEPSSDVGSGGEERVLTVGVNFDEPTAVPEFDPPKAIGIGNSSFAVYVYGSLLRPTSDGGYEPGLAESAEMVDGSTVVVTLRPGLKFQDDTVLDAEAVKFTILRNKDANNNAGFRNSLLQMVESIDVTSPTVLTIHLSMPVAGSFYDLLAQQETFPISPTAVDAGTDVSAEPVGAGPFMLANRTDHSIRLEKWDGYFEASEVQLDAIELVHVASTEAMITAYQSGTIDYGFKVSPDVVSQLNGAPVETEVEVDIAEPQVAWVSFQCNKFPDLLGDVRVRQALIYATDRAELNSLLNPGGREMTQWAVEENPFYDPELAELYTYDVEKAKQLLADAGHSDLTLTMWQSPSALATRVFEVLQQQWAKAGITVDIEPSTDAVADFYMTDTAKATLLVNPGRASTYATKFTTFFSADSIGGTCVPADPDYATDLTELQSLSPTSPEAVELYQTLSRTLLEEAVLVPLFIPPTAQAWSDRLSEFTPRPVVAGYVPDYIGTTISDS